MTTTVYEIKTNNGWEKVRATNFSALAEYCKNKNIIDFRFVGMMSRKEIEESKSLKVVG